MRSFLALLVVLCAATGQSPQRSNSPAALTTGRIIQTYVETDWTFSGDGKAATGAPLGQTFGVVADSSGNVYAADYDNNIVVKFTPGGTLTRSPRIRLCWVWRPHSWTARLSRRA